MADAMVPIYSTTLAASASSVVIGGIPSVYRDLIIYVTGTSGAGQNMSIYLNGDTSASNYPSIYAGGDGSTASAGTLNNYVGGVYGSNLSTNVINIFDYAQTDKQTILLSRLSVSTNAASMIACRWANTAAVTSIQLVLPSTTFSAGTVVSLFGIAG